MTESSETLGADALRLERSQRPRFEIGRVIGESLRVFRRKWRTILSLAVAVWAIAVAQSVSRIATYSHGSHDPRAFAKYWAFAIAFVCVGWLKDAAVVSVALQRPADDRPLAHAVRGGLGVFLPLLPFHALAAGPALLWNAGSNWLLRVPVLQLMQIDVAAGVVFWLYGLVLTALFGLVTPVMLVERCALIEALRRSMVLLSGGRWRFLGLSVLMDIIGALPVTFGGAMMAAVMVRFPQLRGATGSPFFQVESAGVALLASLLAALWMVMTAVSYREFRRLREGAPHDELAAIFA